MEEPTYNFELNDSGDVDMNGRNLPQTVLENPEQYADWFTDLERVKLKPEDYPGWASESRGRIDAINGVDRVYNLKADTGLIIEIAYRVKTMEYAVEDENPRTNTAKQDWQAYIRLWQDVLSKADSTKADIQRALTYIEKAYESYIKTIEEALKEEVDN